VHALPNRHARLIGRPEQRYLGAKALVEDRQTNTVSSTGNSRVRGASPEKLAFQHALSLRSKVSTNRYVHWSARLTDGISG
jgi:hypothetical protein